MKKIYALIMLSLFSVSSAMADSIPDSMKSALKNPSSDMPSLLNLIISLAVVIGLIYLTGWIYQKLNKINRTKLKDMELLERHNFKILSSLALGQHKYLHAVEINGKVLVLGSTPDSISLLKEFDSESAFDNKTNNHIKTEEQIKEEKTQCLEMIYQKYKGV